MALPVATNRTTRMTTLPMIVVASREMTMQAQVEAATMIPEMAEAVAAIVVVEEMGAEALTVAVAAGEAKINLDERNPREVGGDFSL